MNVLQICAYAAPYGGNFLKSLLEIDKIVLQNNGNVVYAFPETARGLDWIQKLQETKKVYFLSLAKARIKPGTYKAIHKIVVKEKIDIIHSHFELYDIPAVVSAPKNVKVFWHLHDAIENGYRIASFSRKLLYKIHYGVLSDNAYLISVSDKHREFAVKLGMNKSNTITVLNGIDTDRIKPYNNPELEKEYDFLIFGWEFKRKAVDLALKCAEQLEKMKYKFSLAVVGTENTWKVPSMSKYTNKSWLRKQGFVSDVNELYQKSKCFLHISRAEGCSYALEEAIYSGIPVICSDISENMIANGIETVDIVECNNEQALLEAMKKRLDNKYSEDETTIGKIRKLIEEKFSVGAWAKHIYSIYVRER